MKRSRWILLLALAACAASNPPSGGSQTHFLRECQSTCPEPYACLCGVCSLSCSANATCSSHGSSECLTLAGAPNECSDATRICDVECSGDGDCAALGSDFSCDQGRCRLGRTPDDAGASGDAGSGSSAGRNGSAGMSGGSGAAGVAGSTAQGGAGADGGMPQDEICDGSDDIRLGLTSGGGWVQHTYQFTNPHGNWFLFVDGKCRYYASADYMNGITTGTITPEQAGQLANDIGWSQIEAWSSYQDRACPDAGATQIFRPGSVATCICSCVAEGPAGLADAMNRAQEWTNELGMQGEPASDVVSALAGEFEPMSPVTLTWPLERTPEAIPGFVQDLFGSPTLVGVRFEDPTEVDQLRELRSAAREEQPFAGSIRAMAGAQPYEVFVRDDLPDAVDSAISALIASSMR